MPLTLKVSIDYVADNDYYRGMTEYSEPELVIPALKFMRDNPSGVTTTQLINHLIDTLQPSGHDMEILEGRNDTYFSQKVRNLKSHNTFERHNWAEYKQIDNTGVWEITPEGLEHLEGIELVVDDSQPEDIVSSLSNQGFSSSTIEKESAKDYSGLIIEEGSIDKRTTTQRNRSSKLREIALSEFKKQHNGQLFCVVCGFNFHNTYGEIGKDFIEIHHLEPMHLMDIEGEQTTLEEAIKKVATVCPNCHRMIHRVKEKMLSVEEVKSLLGKSTS